MADDKTLIAEARKALRCLALELPEAVYRDASKMIGDALDAGERLQAAFVARPVQKLELIRDHAFSPGDPACGWELQCSVSAPVREAGQWVRAHCGHPPEKHQPTSDPIHSKTCVAWTKGEGCSCWASALSATPDSSGGQQQTPEQTPGCESCKGNVAPGKKCWACGLEGPAKPAKCGTCGVTLVDHRPGTTCGDPKPPQTEAAPTGQPGCGCLEPSSFGHSTVCTSPETEFLRAQLAAANARTEEFKREVERRDELLHGADEDLKAANERAATAEREYSQLAAAFDVVTADRAAERLRSDDQTQRAEKAELERDAAIEAREEAERERNATYVSLRDCHMEVEEQTEERDALQQKLERQIAANLALTTTLDGTRAERDAERKRADEAVVEIKKVTTRETKGLQNMQKLLDEAEHGAAVLRGALQEVSARGRSKWLGGSSTRWDGPHHCAGEWRRCEVCIAEMAFSSNAGKQRSEEFAALKAEVAGLVHPEFGEYGRLQETLKSETQRADDLRKSLGHEIRRVETERDGAVKVANEMAGRLGRVVAERDAELREAREAATRNANDCSHLRQSATALSAERDALKADLAEARALLKTLRSVFNGPEHNGAWLHVDAFLARMKPEGGGT